MKSLIKNNKIARIIPYLVGFILIGLWGLYSYSIRHELKVADNKGHIQIVARSGAQSLNNIAVNGYPIDENKIHDSAGWFIQNVDTVDNVYFIREDQLEGNRLNIEMKENVKTLSFEYYGSPAVGILDVYLDGQLYKSVSTTTTGAGRSFETLNFDKGYGVNQGNIIWYLQLIIFLFAILIFVRNRYYENIHKINLVKFILISVLSVWSLLYAMQYLYKDYFTVFGLSFFKTRVYLFLPLLTLLVAILMKVYKETVGKRFHLDKFLYYALTLSSPMISFYIIENTYTQVNIISHSSIIANLLIIYAIFFVLACITSLRAAGIMLAILAFGLGVANKLIIDLRNVPVLFYNIFQVNDGLNVVQNFEFVISNRVMQSLVLAWVVVIVLFFLHKPDSILPYIQKDEKTKFGFLTFSKKALATKMVKVLVGVVIGIYLLPTVIFGIAKRENIKLNLWKMQSTYAHEGFALSFISFYLDSIIEQPKGYSEEKIAEIMKPYKVQENTTKKKPNIIIIQNESQADFSNLPNLKMEPDPLAFQHSLSENAVKGRLNVSVFGGGTANTEYEVLTSNALGNMSPTIFPYQQIVTSDKNSFARTLEEYGYQTAAMHPQTKLNYNRNNVYKNLGFDASYFNDSDPSINTLIENPVLERFYLSDKSLFQGIKKLYETKGEKPLFNFVVTMQNHGGYPEPYENIVKINGSLTDHKPESQFLSLVKKTDDDFKDLVEYFKNQSEPTVLVMYGDHQPALSEEFYKAFMDDSVKSGKYSVPFVIWANFKLPQRAETTMSPNYLVPYLMNILQETEYPVPTSQYYQFLNDVRQKVPILTTWGKLDHDGKEIKNPEKIDEFQHYQIMEYNNAFDKKTIDKYFK